MKKLFPIVLLVITGLLVGQVMAAESPQALVQDTTQRMQDALRGNQTALRQDSSLIYDLVDEIVLPHFDFRTMSRWVLGKYWRQASSAQQERFRRGVSDFISAHLCHSVVGIRQ